MTVVELLSSIARLPGAQLGIGPNTPPAEVERLLSIRPRNQNRRIPPEQIEACLTEAHDHLVSLEALIFPHTLPSDYREFLAACGGLRLEPLKGLPESWLQVYGIGLMADDWFPFLLGDDGLKDPMHSGVLPLAALAWRTAMKRITRIHYLVIASGRRYGCVFAAESVRNHQVPGLDQVVRGIDVLPGTVPPIAPSFLDWLEMLNSKGGLFEAES